MRGIETHVTDLYMNCFESVARNSSVNAFNTTNNKSRQIFTKTQNTFGTLSKKDVEMRLQY